jgi:hypothetical protein
MKERDITLTRRNVDMSLLNGIATTLTSSLEVDEILKITLGQVMSYMKMEAGEIFLLEDDGETLRMVLHRGLAAEVFWLRNIFKMVRGSSDWWQNPANRLSAGISPQMCGSCEMPSLKRVSARSFAYRWFRVRI